VTSAAPPRASVIEARGVSRLFGDKLALRDGNLELGAGDVHALLGPNGAGKTTLLRILSGLLTPSGGVVRILGEDTRAQSRGMREHIGLVPSGDRTFYLRLTGLENLVFFARLHGLRRKRAVERSLELLTDVGLADSGRKPVGAYSHGMQKRLSVARALLTRPEILLVDEATHDLDPLGAATVGDLVGGLTEDGTAVVWATQRLDEIRGFAEGVTLIDSGETRFAGTVPELMAHAVPRRYLVRVWVSASPENPRETVARVLGEDAEAGAIEGDSDHVVLELADGVTIGRALATLADSDVDVLSCREERSEIEEAFLSLTSHVDQR